LDETSGLEDSLLPQRLREIREQRGMSQHELGQLCRMGINQISRYETGRHEPSATNLIKIARILDVSVDYLLGLTNELRGFVVTQDLSLYEREVVDTFRREGWPGVFRLGAERISK